MRIADSQNGAPRRLYPVVQPNQHLFLDVGDGHQLYVEECGNPNGIPVVVLHGGPGGGCSPGMRRFFHPDHYRIILFDQRGCGRSRPHASIEHNTSAHLVADIERIRAHFGIEKWILFGGSWGSTLALLYALAHPNAVTHMVLRGVFLLTKPELDWFYQGGVSRFFPEAWERFIKDIPEDERDDIIQAFNRRLFSGNASEEAHFAGLWTDWETGLASIDTRDTAGSAPSSYARAFARIENHYFVNNGFLERPNQILDDLHLIDHIPATIVQGRYDMICPPYSAYKLHKGLSKSRLIIVPNAGHSLSEQGISSSLVTVMDELG